LREAPFVDGIDVVYPNRHPDTLFGGVVSLFAEGLFYIAAAPPALSVVAKEDLALAGADGAKAWRITPIPKLPPAQVLEPGEAFLDVRDVQDRCYRLRIHRLILPVVRQSENKKRRAGKAAVILND